MEKQEEQKALAPGELMERIRTRLEGLWNANYDNPEMTAALVATYEDARLLKATLDYAKQMAESLAEVALEMRKQRDAALDWMGQQPWKDYKTARHDIAKSLANDARLKVEEVERALGALLGDEDVYLSSFTVQDFYDALRALVEQVREEVQEREDTKED